MDEKDNKEAVDSARRKNAEVLERMRKLLKKAGTNISAEQIVRDIHEDREEREQHLLSLFRKDRHAE